MFVLDAVSGNEAIDCLADGDTLLPQKAVVPCALYNKSSIDHVCLSEPAQCAADLFKVGIMAKALQHFCEDQVTDEDGSRIQYGMKKVGLWVFHAVEVIHLYTCVNNQHG